MAREDRLRRRGRQRNTRERIVAIPAALPRILVLSRRDSPRPGHATACRGIAPEHPRKETRS